MSDTHTMAQWLEYALNSHKRAENTAKHDILKKFHGDQVRQITNFMNKLTSEPNTPLEEYLQQAKPKTK